MDIEIGDLVQLDTWFGDVYAEVSDEFGNMFKHYNYSKDGLKRWQNLEFTDKIRKIVKKDSKEYEEILSNKYRFVLHLSLEHFGAHPKQWKNLPNKRYTSNHPETFSD